MARHHFDRDRVEERYADAREDLPFFLDGAKTDPRNLSLLISTALDVAQCGIALAHDHQIACDALRLAGEASAGLFVAATSEDLPVEIPLGGGTCVYQSRPDQSTVHAFRWIRAFFINAICRASGLIDTMCQTSASLPKRSSTTDPEYRYLYVDALRAFWNRDAEANEKILSALEATDPEREDIVRSDWTLKLDVPQLQHLYYVNNQNVEFAEQFPKAVELHKQYWSSTKNRRNDWEGFVSIELTGLAAMAYDRGISFVVDSDYVPSDLIYGKGML